MTCSECQLQIFGREPGEVELDRDAVVHLTECEDCRELDREVRLNSAALVELRDEPLPIQHRPRRWQPWAAALVAAAAAIAIVLLAPRDFPHPPDIPVPGQVNDPPIIAEAPRLTELPKPELRVTRVRPVVKPRLKPAPQPKQSEQPEQPLLVKFITDDPDVVVYWIVDNNQGEPGL